VSVFHIDAGTEWREGQRQALFVAREVRAKGYAQSFVVPPGSALGEQASAEGFEVLPFAVGTRLSLTASFRLAGQLRQRNCLVVHFHDLQSASACSGAVSRAKVPVRVLSGRADLAGRPSRLDTGGFDVVIAPSTAAKDVLVRGGFPETGVEVIPAGADLAAFRDVPDRGFLRREFGFAVDDFLVGVVAHLEDERGLSAIIDAAAILRQSAPKIRFVFLGEGSLRLEAGPETPEALSGWTYFLGFRDEAPRALASLDLFVLSSHLQGLGSWLIEAMASRLPVVATQSGSVPELIIHKESGLLVPPRDAKSLAEEILKLYSDRNLAARLAAHGSETVENKFSAEAMARKILAIYERLAYRKGLKLA
jgi:glycosyltransferase involved in cell wall biosynthesis